MKFSITSLLTASAAMMMQCVRSADFDSSEFRVWYYHHGVEEVIQDAIMGGVTTKKHNKTSDPGSMDHMGSIAKGALGMPPSAIISTGRARGAEKAKVPNWKDPMGVSSSRWCGPQSHDASIVAVDILVPPLFDTILVDSIEIRFMIATREAWRRPSLRQADHMGIFLDGVPIFRERSDSVYLQPELGVLYDDHPMSYAISSQPLIGRWPLSPGPHELVFAVCDDGDSAVDSALMFRARMCQAPNGLYCSGTPLGEVQIRYVTTTKTIERPTPLYTSTIKASGFAMGTIEVAVYDPDATPTGSGTNTSMVSNTTATASNGPTITSTSLNTSVNATMTHSTTRGGISGNVTWTSDIIRNATSTTTTSGLSWDAGPGIETETETKTSTSLQQPGTSLSSAGSANVSFTASPDLGNSSLTLTPRHNSTSLSTPAPSTTTSVTPENQARIARYTYMGCLGSLEGYPSFNLIADAPDMTIATCIDRAGGLRYIGVFESSCYGANSLEDTEILGDAMCDIPCPGDARLICGGRRFLVPRRRNLELSQRAAPADIFLTAYALIINDAIPQPASSSATTSTATATDTAGPAPQDGISSDDPTWTRVTTVITVVYTVVDAHNPANLIATEFHTTVVYLSGHDRVPSVEMILTEASCRACGPGGADSIVLTVPASPPTEAETAIAQADLRPAGSEDLEDGPDPHDSPNGGQPGQDCRTCGIVSGALSEGPQMGKIPFATARPEVVLAGSLQKSAGYVSLGLVSLVIGLLIVI